MWKTFPGQGRWKSIPFGNLPSSRSNDRHITIYVFFRVEFLLYIDFIKFFYIINTFSVKIFY